MKIISWNVNGLRAVGRRGFGEWLKNSRADVVCLQEIKCGLEDIPKELKNPPGFFSFYNPAAKKGYAGVAVYSKQKPLKVVDKFGMKRFDDEGRFLRLEYPDFILINLYLPHGGRAKENLGYKLEAYRRLGRYLKNLDSGFRRNDNNGAAVKDSPVLLAGDFNIAHTELDLARPKQNKNNIMFTAEERAQIDKIVGLGFVDSFRKLHPREQKFTWWPYFANARQRNLGWRIDYAFVSKRLVPSLKSASVLSDVMGSDHCPIEVKIY